MTFAWGAEFGAKGVRGATEVAVIAATVGMTVGTFVGDLLRDALRTFGLITFYQCLVG